MTICCYTSFTFSYLSKARVLLRTVREFHPEWVFCAVITDRPPPGFEFRSDVEGFDEVLWGDEIFGQSTKSWLFKHNVVEACTAVKGFALRKYLTADFAAVIYLDPDTALFSRLDPIIEALETNSIVLTPHQIDPDTRRIAILDNEVSSLKHGVFNLGFVAVKRDAEGLRFAEWWEDRLSRFCFDELSDGLFVDQKWCDLVPCFFSGVHVCRNPGCNVASWNLNKRQVTINDVGQILVNGAPLRFFHFTKLGPVGDLATQRYAADNFEVYEIWSWYKRKVAECSVPSIPASWWRYGYFDDGAPISMQARRLYRQREDLQAHFKEPFSSGANSYQAWLDANLAENTN